MIEFYACVKVIKHYGGRTPIHPGLVKSKLSNMVVQDTNNLTPEYNLKA